MSGREYQEGRVVTNGDRVLINRDGKPVRYGDNVVSERGSNKPYRVIGAAGPRSEDVQLQYLGTPNDFARNFHPHAFDLKWVNPSERYVVVGMGDEGIHRFDDRASFEAWVKASASYVLLDEVHRSPHTMAGLQGQPLVRGLVGPMWDGDCIRYETGDAYSFYST